MPWPLRQGTGPYMHIIARVRFFVNYMFCDFVTDLCDSLGEGGHGHAPLLGEALAVELLYQIHLQDAI